MPSSHLILCCPLLLLPPILPSIRVFSNESTLLMRWPKYWSFSFSITPSNEHPGLLSFWLPQDKVTISASPSFCLITDCLFSFTYLWLNFNKISSLRSYKHFIAIHSLVLYWQNWEKLLLNIIWEFSLPVTHMTTKTDWRQCLFIAEHTWKHIIRFTDLGIFPQAYSCL